MAERLEDLNLPNASVQKIIKDALPDSVNIGKDARTALARAASVFVLYITSYSVQEAQRVNRKTLNGQDVIDALESLEFDSLIKPLTECLHVYKDSLKNKKNKMKSKKADEDGDEAVVEVDDEEDEVEDEK